MESDRDVIQPECEPPYYHARTLVDFQPRRYLWWCRHVGYLAYLLWRALSLLESLNVETGKAEPRCFR